MTSVLRLGGIPAEPSGWRDLARVPAAVSRAYRRAVAGAGGSAPRPPYDVLRTRAGQVMGDAGWTRLGVAQTRRALAGTATALNLALSEARRPERRVVLVDLDLAGGAVLQLLGQQLVAQPGSRLTEGRLRLDDNLALLAYRATPGAESEIVSASDFRAGLARALDGLQPDLTVFHFPPMLEGDAGIAAMDLCDAVLLVVDGTADTPGLLRDVESLIAPRRPLLGLFHHAAEV